MTDIAQLGCSGEVGLGLNMRRMIMDFLGTFTIAYSLRPIGDIGTVFRRYPGQWKVTPRNVVMTQDVMT